jgi:hypothetical protein
MIREPNEKKPTARTDFIHILATFAHQWEKE